jgi:RluA family pseudouridine synthase
VQSGDLLVLKEKTTSLPKVYPLRLTVLFEDEQLALIHKPAGIPVSGNRFKTIYNALPFTLKNSRETDRLPWPTPVHRLDHQTAGILLVAKTGRAQIHLSKQFEEQSIQKTYSALVIGKTAEKGTVCLPLDNKPSETCFVQLETLPSKMYGSLSSLKVFPKTGRTHQIRKHLSAIGHPILGDPTYGKPFPLYKGKGLFLCATEITFLHPISGESIHYEIALPKKFKRLILRGKEKNN